jgi:hypothetical protein
MSSLALDWNQLPDAEAAKLISASVRRWDETARLKYAEIGLMALAVQKRLLWQHIADEDGLPCRSFARWVRVCAPHAYSTVYAALRDCEALEDIPAAALAQIPQSSFRAMKELSTKVRADPKVLAAAKVGRAELVAHVKAHWPTQHVESRTLYRLNPTESQRAEIEEAVGLAIARGDATSAEEAIYSWAVDYKQTCRENDAAIETVVGRIQ